MLRSIFSLTLTLLLVASCAVPTSAQRRRKRSSRTARVVQTVPPPDQITASSQFDIPTSKIKHDVVGMTLRNIRLLDGRTEGQWQFAESEWKEVGVVETDVKGNNATVIAHLQTGDDTSELDGKIRLYYERNEDKWELSSIENIDCKFTRQPNATTSSTLPAEQPSAPAFMPLLNGSVTIGAGKRYSVQFHTDSPARVTGWFRAEGGGGNDIECYILDEIQYENFQNGHSTPTYYNSRRVTVQRLNAQIPPGRYYLVFNNSYSLITPKAVSANISLVR